MSSGTGPRRSPSTCPEVLEKKMRCSRSCLCSPTHSAVTPCCTWIYFSNNFSAHADGERRGAGSNWKGGIGKVSVGRVFRSARVLGARRRHAPRYSCLCSRTHSAVTPCCTLIFAHPAAVLWPSTVAYKVMAYLVMAYIVMAIDGGLHSYGLFSYGLYSYGHRRRAT